MIISKIENDIQSDCYSYFKKEREHALVLSSMEDGLEFVNMKLYNEWLRPEIKDKLIRECFNYLLNKYYQKDKTSTGMLSNMLFWWAARKVLWWLAQKLIQKLLDAAVRS